MFHVHYTLEVKNAVKELYGADGVMYGLALSGSPRLLTDLYGSISQLDKMSARDVLADMSKNDGQVTLGLESQSLLRQYERREDLDELFKKVVRQVLAVVEDDPRLIVCMLSANFSLVAGMSV